MRLVSAAVTVWVFTGCSLVGYEQQRADSALEVTDAGPLDASVDGGGSAAPEAGPETTDAEVHDAELRDAGGWVIIDIEEPDAGVEPDAGDVEEGDAAAEADADLDAGDLDAGDLDAGEWDAAKGSFEPGLDAAIDFVLDSGVDSGVRPMSTDQLCYDESYCSPDCSGLGGNCALGCDNAGTCEPTCPSATSCAIVCRNTKHCNVLCAPGSNCHVLCDNSDCSGSWCALPAVCRMTCINGGDCSLL